MLSTEIALIASTNKTASDTLKQQLETIAVIGPLFERLTNSHSSRLEWHLVGSTTLRIKSV